MYHNKFILVGGLITLMAGCASTGNKVANKLPQYNSVQELIAKQQLNQADKSAKEYVYDWGINSGGKAVQAGIPKWNVQAHCQNKGGKLTHLHKTEMSMVKETWTKRLLQTYSAVKDNTGAFRCVQKDGQQWIVSIEAISERKIDANKDTRVVALLTREMSVTDAQNFYRKAKVTPAAVPTNNRTSIAKAPTTPKVEKKEETPIEKPEEKPVVAPVKVEQKETKQQQQNRLYLEGRRNLNQGVNTLNACNQLERAYGMGRFYNSSGPNIYIESGVLVARCLTTVPAYQKKFGNPKLRAKNILQGIVKSSNHRVAKSMLEQLK